ARAAAAKRTYTANTSATRRRPSAGGDLGFTERKKAAQNSCRSPPKGGSTARICGGYPHHSWEFSQNNLLSVAASSGAAFFSRTSPPTCARVDCAAQELLSLCFGLLAAAVGAFGWPRTMPCLFPLLI